MFLRPETINQALNPSFIGKRQEHKSFTATVRMVFAPKKEGEEAGLVVERDKDYFFKFTLTKQNGKTGLTLVSNSGTENKLLASKEINLTSGNVLFLRVSSEEVFYSFRYSVDGKIWNPLLEKTDGRFLGIDAAGRFTGTMIGMYASSNGTLSENTVDFDWFEYLGK